MRGEGVTMIGADGTVNLDQSLERLDNLRAAVASRGSPMRGAGGVPANWILDTFESNRIEGNPLTLHETQQIARYGNAIGGRPLWAQLEVVNHIAALKYVDCVSRVW